VIFAWGLIVMRVRSVIVRMLVAVRLGARCLGVFSRMHLRKPGQDRANHQTEHEQRQEASVQESFNLGEARVHLRLE
jgi:hypothetical protein